MRRFLSCFFERGRRRGGAPLYASSLGATGDVRESSTAAASCVAATAAIIAAMAMEGRKIAGGLGGA